MRWSKQKVLITGAAGFLGSALGRQLKEKVVGISVLDDLSTGAKENVTKFADEFVRERVTTSALSRFKDIDIVFHFGAPSSIILFERNPNSLAETVEGMKAVLDYCQSSHVRKLVYASSSSVYGKTMIPQSEETLAAPINEYGVAKLCCEHMARIRPEVNSTGLRIFAGYGPGEGRKVGFCSVIGIFLANLSANESPIIFGSGKQTRDFVFVDDIVDCTLKAADNDYRGVINVGSGESKNFLELLELISAQTNRKIIPKFVPEPKLYFEHTRADTTRLRSVLDVRPITVEMAMARYLERIGFPLN